MKISKKYRSLALSILLCVIAYGIVYHYTKDKITPLKASSYVNYYDQDLALQVDDVQYIFPSWIILSKGTVFYKQEPVFSFDKAKFTISLFSLLNKYKKFKYNILASDGKLDGRYSGDKIEMDIEDLQLAGVPLLTKYHLKGDLQLKLDIKIKDGKIKDGGCNFLISEFGFSAPVSYIKDASLRFGKVNFQSRLEQDLLKVERFDIQGDELRLQSFGKIKKMEGNYLVELKGKKRLAPTIFDKIKNGFFVGLYLADAVGQDCYFQLDYSEDGLDYQKIDDNSEVEVLEEELQKR